MLILFAALAVAQGATSPPSNREGDLPGHSDNSLLYNLLQTAGFTDSCVSGVLDMCSAAQDEAHFPSLIQEVQEVKTELQKMKVEADEGKVHLQEVKEEVHEVKWMLLQLMLMLNKTSRPRHCMDLLDSGDRESGLRHVYPYSGRPNHSITVYCDQQINGGGWTVFQRRVNNSLRLDFYRNWTEYQAGFGDVSGEFWLGLDILHQLTKTEQELRIDLYDYEGEHRWAEYGTFRVGSEDTNYRLSIGRYSGDAGDSLAVRHNDQEFSTYDADHDKHSGNCAEERQGAWWYDDCHDSNLNGYQYVGDNSPWSKGIVWYHFRRHEYSLMQTTMMIRPAL